jgi:uncharacterized protein (TIGR02145 family)
MKSISKFALKATLVLALTFTLSCSSGDDGQNPSSSSVGGEGNSQSYSYCLVGEMCLDGPFTLNDCNSLGGLPSNSCPYGGVEQSSSSSSKPSSSSSSEPPPPSSSSMGLSSSSFSSSSAGCTAAGNTETHYCSNGTIKEYGFVTDAGGQTYKTIVIGEQTWMAENLNYEASGGKCYGNEPENCGKYGRLYDWSTAIALPSSCDSSYCSSQIQSKHKGICPEGWHLPSGAEWDVLVNFAGDLKAGTKLKAESGWKSGNGNGTNNYGFSALPGGRGYSHGYFITVGDIGNWWSASEVEGIGYNAYCRDMSHGYEYVYRSHCGKSILFSVRCLQD